MKKISSLLTHPLFVYLVIVGLSCIPKTQHTEIFYTMPNVGDNFIPTNSQTVYYYNGKGKLVYTSPECFFKAGNPEFGTHWTNGGIKYVAAEICVQIPFLGNYCDSTGQKFIGSTSVKKTNPILNYFNTDFLLGNYSEIAHFISYFLLTLSLLNYLKSKARKYVWAILISFLAGLLAEIIQELFTSTREASWEDMILNTLGAFLGLFCYFIYDKWK